jgi:hypothetical protein
VVGEMALLTGARSDVTIRAVEGAVVYELGTRHYVPLLERRPEWLGQLKAIMVTRMQVRQERLEARAGERRRAVLTRWIRRALLAG